jgi:hypothetical protein
LSPKTNTDIFGLSPVRGRTDVPTSDLAPLRRSQGLSQAQRRTLEELAQQQLAMIAQREKTKIGQRYVGELHQHAAATFLETAEAIWALRDGTRDRELQAYIDAFCHRQVKLAGVFVEEATTTGANNILLEISRALYFAPEDERRGFLARLFGGSNGY